MNDLIKITTSKIGAETINSVNARDIHEYLEIKTQFSTWIQRAIEKYDFIQDNDYSILNIANSNGGRDIVEYIVDLDMAKELAMLENNPKGKETRKYFIAAEKLSSKTLTLPEQISLIAQGYENQNERIEIIEHKIDNEILLTSAQKHNLRNLVNKKVFDLKEAHNFSDDFIKKGYMRVWKKLKNHFVVSSYMEIPKVKFEEATQIIKNVEIGDLI